MEEIYFRYWGKARPESDTGPAYHLLPYHSLDVAAVGWHLLNPTHKLCRNLAEQLGVESEWLQRWYVFCLSLHDIGKFAVAFQGQVAGLSDRLVERDGRFVYSERHDSLGYGLWDEWLVDRWLSGVGIDCSVRNLRPWLESVTGHHGVPPKLIGRLEHFFTERDKQAVEAYIAAVHVLLLDGLDLAPLADKGLLKLIQSHSWQLAGIAVLADWLGSDQQQFSYQSEPQELSQYWRQVALPKAGQALAVAGLQPQQVASFKSIQQLFPFIETPTPLQRYALSVPLSTHPQLFILEDVTGAGKTEAALILTHRLMDKGLADGLYVGLPTMATANGMYRRLAKAYRSLYSEQAQPSLVLAHGARQHSQDFIDSIAIATQPCDRIYAPDESSASAFCSAWVADSRKKALLADVGVGTLDQALLGILPARHQSLRMLGLARKVLLVDEIHAIDSYMQGLLETLLEAQARQGGSVVLLSATLPMAMRNGLTNAYRRGLEQDALALSRWDYPLVTQLAVDRKKEIPVATRPEVERDVVVVRLASEQEVLDQILNSAAAGHCVCWVRNTVGDARRAYKWLQQSGQLDVDKLMLFHSRFTVQDRQRIENQVLDLFGPDSSSEDRRGRVLISTQVVEQSLDLDFDLMISDLAPIDLLIQRAGRLHRHVRDKWGQRLANGQVDQRSVPTLYLLAPSPDGVEDEQWLTRLLPGSAYVYTDTGQLWLTARLLEEKQGFSMPEDARTLIEGVYGSDVQAEVPDVLLDASFTARSEARTKRGMAGLNALKLERGYSRRAAEDNSGWDEDVRIPTRLTDDSTAVTLAVVVGDRLQPLAQGEVYQGAKAWAMNTLNLRDKDWYQAEKRIPERWRPVIEQLKEDNPCLRWVEILPLCGENAECYSAEGGWDITRNKEGENQ